MSKNREAITTNGRAAFYACMLEDIRKAAMDLGWAVALHGSLQSDMDMMAMPWTEEAKSFEALVNQIAKLFSDNDLAAQYQIAYNEKPHGRIVATIPIWADFYLDISTMSQAVYTVDAHECQYCGEPTPGADSDVLCASCREVFGHALYSEL